MLLIFCCAVLPCRQLYFDYFRSAVDRHRQRAIFDHRYTELVYRLAACHARLHLRSVVSVMDMHVGILVGEEIIRLRHGSAACTILPTEAYVPDGLFTLRCQERDNSYKMEENGSFAAQGLARFNAFRIRLEAVCKKGRMATATATLSNRLAYPYSPAYAHLQPTPTPTSSTATVAAATSTRAHVFASAATPSPIAHRYGRAAAPSTMPAPSMHTGLETETEMMPQHTSTPHSVSAHALEPTPAPHMNDQTQTHSHEQTRSLTHSHPNTLHARSSAAPTDMGPSTLTGSSVGVSGSDSGSGSGFNVDAPHSWPANTSPRSFHHPTGS